MSDAWLREIEEADAELTGDLNNYACSECARHRRALLRYVERLREYVRHKNHCDMLDYLDERKTKCTCGLEAALSDGREEA